MSELTYFKVGNLAKSKGLELRPCGLSADWIALAFHVGGEYLDGTGVYVVDDEEDNTCSVIVRTYTDDGVNDDARISSDNPETLLHDAVKAVHSLYVSNNNDHFNASTGDPK